MASDRISDAELQALSEDLTQQFEESLRTTSFTAEELTDLAARQRSLAQVSDSPGQRRALLDFAERCERAAQERVAVRR